jgi:hypothetical protein
MDFSPQDLADLRCAKDLLEHPGLAARITSLFGTPIEKGFKLLPERWSETVQEATTTALQRALNFAVGTLGDSRHKRSSNFIHKMCVAASGGVAGALGLSALAVELPLSTTIMLRSIADIARSEGEPIKEVEAKLACLEVFALGGPSTRDNAAEAGYFAVRVALARAISEAAQFIAERGMAEEGAPVLVRLIATIAGRFGTVVSEKLAAQAIPVIGAAGGALINTLFIHHFQEMARGHFTVRRLERKYGADEVRLQYEQL